MKLITKTRRLEIWETDPFTPDSKSLSRVIWLAFHKKDAREVVVSAHIILPVPTSYIKDEPNPLYCWGHVEFMETSQRWRRQGFGQEFYLALTAQYPNIFRNASTGDGRAFLSATEPGLEVDSQP